jgi:hypothetical protein
MLHTQLAALVLALTTLVVSGCGGSSKSTVASNATTQASTGSTEPSTSSTPSGTGSTQTSASADESLIAQANTICRHTKAVVAANNPRVKPGHSDTLQQTAARISRSVSYVSQEGTELAKLTRSSSSSHQWQPLISAIHVFSGDLNGYVVAIRTGAPQATDNQLLQKVTSGQGQMGPAATRIGATECATPE